MHLDPKTWWYLSRASGFVAWALLAASVLWGLFITNKTLVKSTPPAWVLDLHRHLGGLAVAFVAVHLAALPLDGYTHWSAADLFVPMHSAWHPLAIAWGVVAMYLLLAVEISSLLGRRVPRTWWRRIHMLSFPLYILASIHLFAAGTDARNTVTQWSVVVVSTLIAFLTGVRLLAVTNPRETASRVPRAAREAGASPRPPAASEEPPIAAAAPDPPVPVATTADLLPGRAVETVVHSVATPTQETDARPARRPRPATSEERAARIREVARLAAARQATAPDSLSDAMSAGANPQA